MKFRRISISITVATMLFIGLLPTAMAATNDTSDYTLIDDPGFLQSANITKTEIAPEVYEYEFIRKENSTPALLSCNESENTQSSAKLIVYDETNADKVDAYIQSARLTGETPKSQYELDGSLYMEITIKYDTIAVQQITKYRINSVTTKTSVNSGTTITSKSLMYGCTGLDEQNAPVTYSGEIDLLNKSNPYTTTVMSSYPYVHSPFDGILGATLWCSAKRPGNSTVYTYTLSNNIF